MFSYIRGREEGIVSDTSLTILQSDQYLHRVGRAGRFGTKGLAISFVSNEEDAKQLEQVQVC